MPRQSGGGLGDDLGVDRVVARRANPADGSEVDVPGGVAEVGEPEADEPARMVAAPRAASIVGTKPHAAWAIVRSDAGGGSTMSAPMARRMSSAWVHVSKARTSAATRVAARPPHQRIGSSRRASPRTRELRVGRLRRSLQLGDGVRRRTSGVPGAGLRGAALVVRGGLGDAGHRHAQLVGEQRLVGGQVDDDVMDGPAGELGRVDRASPVVGREVAQQQDGPRQLDAVDVDRRGAGDHRGRRRGGGVPRRARGTAARGRA